MIPYFDFTDFRLTFDFNLKRVRIDLHFLDLINRWHKLLVMLLFVLDLAQLADLEHLEPALVAEDRGRELDHLGVHSVVGRNVGH